MRAAFVFSSQFQAYSFGDDHPLRPLRLQLLYELLESAGLLNGNNIRLVSPPPASDDELLTVHDRGYIEAVKALSHNPAEIYLYSDQGKYGFDSPDNPAFAGMHEVSALIVGGAIAAAELIISREVVRAFHPGGGLHHAMPNRASGFCIYNDPACAIQRFLDRGWRVLYIDGDAHHGDGVEAIFADNPRVLTISIHEDGRFLFPGTGDVTDIGHGAGRGFSVNLPLMPGTGDASWVQVFSMTVPTLARAFRPDVIVTQHGCDAHRWDPLSHLAVSTFSLEYWARCVDQLSQELCEGRWLALGGGGYDIWRVVPRAWSLVWSAVVQREVSEDIPDQWLRKWQAEAEVQLPAQFRDSQGNNSGYDAEDDLATVNQATARRALELCLPYIEDTA